MTNKIIGVDDGVVNIFSDVFHIPSLAAFSF